MAADEVVTLIRYGGIETDEDGNAVPAEIRTEVFARRLSVG